MSQEETVTISKKEFEFLFKRSEWLSYLEAAGVDNWVGYDYAVDLASNDNFFDEDE